MGSGGGDGRLVGGWLSLLTSASSAGKWLGFVMAVWVQCVSGNNYTFSNYSDSIKTLMGFLTQLQLRNLSIAKDVGKAFALLPGLASDHFPTPLLLFIGSLEGIVGYGAQWLVVSRRIRPLPYWQMCVFLCMGGNSTTWMNTAVLVTCFRNFRKNRGPVSGIIKGYIGLSTAIFTDLCTALFSSSPIPFLLMLALVPAAICTLAMPFLRESLPRTRSRPTSPPSTPSPSSSPSTSCCSTSPATTVSASRGPSPAASSSSSPRHSQSRCTRWQSRFGHAASPVGSYTLGNMII